MTDQHAAVERGRLTLVCRSCTRTHDIYGPDQSSCELEAFRQGWVNDAGRMICPKCPAARERKAKKAA